MRMLFLLWILIISGVVDANRWPTQVVGVMPTCDKPSFSSMMPTCAGEPAWKVFIAARQATDPAAPPSEAVAGEAASEEQGEGESISNGF